MDINNDMVSPHSPASVSMIVDGKNFFSNNTLMTSLKSRRLENPVDNGLTCEGCHKNFSFFIRAHHCRRCGHCFCWECSQYYSIVPKELLLYNNYTSWWVQDKPLRCCNKCSDEIKEYNIHRETIRSWRTEGIALDRLYYKHPDVCVANYLTEMRVIQYLPPSKQLRSAELAFVHANAHFLAGHSRWIPQLLKAGLQLEGVAVHTECDYTLCGRDCKKEIDASILLSVLPYLKMSVVKGEYVSTRLENAVDSPVFVLALPFLLRANIELVEMIVQMIVESDNVPLVVLTYWLLNYLSNSEDKALANRYMKVYDNLLTGVTINFLSITKYRQVIDTFLTSVVSTSCDIIDPISYSDGMIEIIDKMVLTTIDEDPLKPEQKVIEYSYFRKSLLSKEPLIQGTRVITMKNFDGFVQLAVTNISKLIKEKVSVIDTQLSSAIVLDSILPISSNSTITSYTETEVKTGEINLYSVAYWLTLSLVLGIEKVTIKISHDGSRIYYTDILSLQSNSFKRLNTSIEIENSILKSISEEFSRNKLKSYVLLYFNVIKSQSDFIHSMLSSIPGCKDVNSFLNERLLIGYNDIDAYNILNGNVDSYATPTNGGYTQYIWWIAGQL